jgi:release factor glutamine methyltransferase
MSVKTIIDTLQKGVSYLEKNQIDEARLNMEHLLAHVLGCRRLDLYLRFGEVLEEKTLEPLRGLIKKRAEGVPLQHLLGNVQFLDLEIVCDHRALIPRPETECLVDQILKQYQARPPKRVLDLCCGSGCIGLAVAKHWSDCDVVLADISEDALDLARYNSERLTLHQVKIIRSDLFETIVGKFDLIISNPPYIPSAEIQELSREVKNDPHLALDGGEDGLDIVRKIAQQVEQYLNEGGSLIMEVGHDQHDRAQQCFSSECFEYTEGMFDLQGIKRFVEVKLKSQRQAMDKVAESMIESVIG